MQPAAAGSPVADAPAGPGAGAVRDGVVSRPGLFQRLAQAQRVVQVSAPPGSGKTVLLRSWIAEPGQAGRIAWVQVPGECDPQRFWISVTGALRATAAGSALVRALTAAPDLDGWTVVERLLEDLASLEDRVWLVLDDVHELCSAEAQRQLELLIMRAPPALRFVLVTRHDLRLGLHRLRLAGELTEIRVTDLRFTLPEARALLDAAGVALSDSAMTALYDRTEGWAAGLRLAALSLAGHPDPERFAAEFGGSERTVAEYLVAEVLERQPEPARRLLIRTSILDRVNGELADLLTGGSGGERVLQQLEEAGAFVVSLDARRSWFRYHQLFADLLQLELRASEPTGLTALHDAAADWYAEHGYPVEAVRHAQAARNWDLAARVLSDHWVGLGLAGLGGTAHGLLARFPADVVAADAELAARVAGDQLARGSLEEAERYLALSARALTAVPAARRDRAQAVLAVVRMHLARKRGDLTAVAQEADLLLAPAVAAEPGQPGLSGDLRALALIDLGISELWTAHIDEADRHLNDAIALAHQIGRPYLEVTGLAFLSQLMSWRSFPLGAERSLQAIELANQHGWSDEPVTGIAYLALGVTMVTQGRLEEAERALGQAERTIRTEVEPAAGMRLQYGRGMLEFVCGRYDTALRAFQAAERLSGSLRTPHTLAPRLRSHLLQTLVRRGETQRVEQALAGMDRPERERGEMRIAEASLRLDQGEPKAAAALLAPVIDGSAAVPNAHLWDVQASLLNAIASDALGAAGAARTALEQALDRAEPESLLFPFLYDPAPGLLDRHRRYGTAHGPLIAQILNVLAGQNPSSEPSGPRRLREPLSHAEARVLRYLPTKLSAPEIADEMYLSANTVKTHMRHLYDKLGVHRRHEAVEQARALGLLATSPRRPAAFRGSELPGLMTVPAWLTVISWIFLGLGLVTAALVVADIYLRGYRQDLKVMEAVWPLTALYAGPLAAAAWVRWGRPMSRRQMMAHDGMPPRPYWATVAVGATHCGSGCVLGDLIAEWAVFAAGWQLAGLALPAEYPFDYVLALSWGILFQYFAIVPVRHVAVREGLKLAARADFLALTAFEVGLFGWMAIMQFVLFTSPHLPTDTAAFWFLMQVGMLAGYATSYPMNWWLIRAGIKDAM